MPTLQVNPSVSSDDGQLFGSNAAYPPAFASATTGGLVDIANKSLNAGPSYDLRNVLMRFDTSPIPDDATITAATLRLYITSAATADARFLVCEYYAASNWPIDISDGVETPNNNAFDRAIGLITAGVQNDFALINSNPNLQINKAGFTGFRLGIDGGAPTATNQVQIASFDHPTNPKPLLIVTYTVLGGYEWLGNVWKRSDGQMRKIGTLAAAASTGANTHASVACDEREGGIMIGFRITAVGATPTITFKVQGSFDEPGVADAASDWADLELDPLDNSAAAASFTKTAVGISQFAVPPQDLPRKIRLVTSANTNVTYDAQAYQ